MMNYVDLFWMFGHPEVYILILPAFGVYSEVVSTFSSKELYGYVSLVLATTAIAVLSFTVWVHHFFTMGQNANINAVFGIATMTIGIPTGVKIYDWIWTMFRGRGALHPAHALFAGLHGHLRRSAGFTGIILAMPPLDFLVHNTLFLVAHFHNVLIPGLLYGMLAGYSYWFPKAFGFRLDERWGRISLRLLGGGLLHGLHAALRAGGQRHGATDAMRCSSRRSGPWLYVAARRRPDPAGRPWSRAIRPALVVSVRNRDKNRVFAGDPWDGRNLEWSTSAPPPEYNFAVIPHGRIIAIRSTPPSARASAIPRTRALPGDQGPARAACSAPPSASPATLARLRAWSGTCGGWRCWAWSW